MQPSNAFFCVLYCSTFFSVLPTYTRARTHKGIRWSNYHRIYTLWPSSKTWVVVTTRSQASARWTVGSTPHETESALARVCHQQSHLHNSLERLRLSMAAALARLAQLNLAHNNLSQLPKELFKCCESLIRLDLRCWHLFRTRSTTAPNTSPLHAEKTTFIIIQCLDRIINYKSSTSVTIPICKWVIALISARSVNCNNEPLSCADSVCVRNN